jgi:hypothetical protein
VDVSDLERLLAHRGAFDERLGVTALGPDLSGYRTGLDV